MVSNYALSYGSSRSGRGRRMRQVKRAPRAIALAAVLACGAFVGIAGNVYGGGANTVHTVRVHAGDTLWSIADHAYPGDGDLRDRIATIADVNHLNGGLIVPGQELTIPTS